ncbi:hypothetical protein POTOM_023522 [Populus tomentosa]|uniref:dolichyl-diphosphooligosaccharide--protein glycotransferase n=1 Tax=Populus tomentosa TaxID=118781 RepID=A0A8X7ZMF3_POPTO|nr:hypothetical protein POTOM_023522 [Populus tomentosa]
MAVAESSRETTAGTLRNAFGNVLSFFILLLIGVLAFSIRLFSVIKYESAIHEFDPYFNYRVTQFLTKNGVYDFRSWYPLGRVIDGTVYPGVTLTAGTLWCLFVYSLHQFSLHLLHGRLTLTKEVKGTGAGLTAAILLAMVNYITDIIVVPSYISRSVAGSYDNEAAAIFALIFTFYLYIKTLNTGSLLYATLNTLACFYMVVLGTLLVALVPVVGFDAVMMSEHFASFLVFIIIHVVALVYHVKGILSPRMFEVDVMLVGCLLCYGSCSSGTGSFQPNKGMEWMKFELASSSCFLPLSDASSFVVLYIVSSVYFSGVMVRLMLVLAPVACIMSGIALSEAFNVLTRSIKFQLPGSSETSQVDVPLMLLTIKSGDTRTSTDGEQNDIANTEKVDKIVKGRLSKKNKKNENEPVERASVKSRIERRILVLPFETSVIVIILLVLLGAFYVVYRLPLLFPYIVKFTCMLTFWDFLCHFSIYGCAW